MRVFSRVVLFLTSVLLLPAAPFTVVTYNVENLFDADGVALYDDYQPTTYTPRHFATKLANIAEVITKFGGGVGPDVILFQEIEVDQTPGKSAPDYAAILQRLEGRTAVEWLSGDLSDAMKDLPAEAWLLKALADRGLTGYTVVSGDGGYAAGEERPAIKCVTFTRLPVLEVKRHPTENARDILETKLNVDGYPFYVFNLHWKSGASDPKTEATRVQNAEVLRARLDRILASDPAADVLIGGDFNSQYNQKQRYPEMKLTGINDVLGSQGNELALRGATRDLYNLWFELPEDQRGSDTYRGEWGTLIQMIISRGLYDQNGVQYQDNSFGVARIPGLNVDVAGIPERWIPDGETGAGFSDHLPVYAHFRTVPDRRTDRWMELARPSQTESDAAIRPVSYSSVDLSSAIKISDLPPQANLRDGSWSGKLFKVEGPSVENRYPMVRFAGEDYEIYGVNKDVRGRIYEQRDRDQAFVFYGEIGTYKGKWQFVVQDPSWVPEPKSK